jgi:hypothetical protein
MADVAQFRAVLRDYGPASSLVRRLIEQAGGMTLDDAADLYRARASHLLLKGVAADRRAAAQAERAAAAAGLAAEYERARHDSVTAWRRALPETQGPWLVVGQAVANAAGALVVNGVVDHTTFQHLFGPWRQAMGTLVPVGPGVASREPVPR